MPPIPPVADPYYQKGVNLLAKATLSKDGKMVPAPGTAEALNKYLELAPDGKYAQAAKDLLTSIGAPVQTSFGTRKKARNSCSSRQAKGDGLQAVPLLLRIRFLRRLLMALALLHHGDPVQLPLHHLQRAA